MKFGVISIIAFILGCSFWTSIYKPLAPLTSNMGKMPVSEQLVNDNCNFDGITPEVIATGETDTTEWNGRFDLPDMPYIWEPAKPFERILSFRETLRERLGAEIDSRELTERQYAIFVNLPDEWSGEATNSASC